MIITLYHCNKLIMDLVDNFDHLASREGNIKIFNAESIKADNVGLRLYRKDTETGRKVKAIIDSRLFTYFDVM